MKFSIWQVLIFGLLVSYFSIAIHDLKRIEPKPVKHKIRRIVETWNEQHGDSMVYFSRQFNGHEWNQVIDSTTAYSPNRIQLPVHTEY